MHRILAALLVLLACTPAASAPKKTTVETLVRSGASWNGTTLPAWPAGKPEVALLRITIPGRSELPWHTHPVINVGLMLQGRLTVITRKGEVLRLKKGDPIVEVVNTWHMGRNEHDEPVVIVVFYAGAKGMTLTAGKH